MGFFFSTIAPEAVANDEASAVQTVSYSTGQNGGRLKWLPRRAESVQDDSSCVTAAAHAAPTVMARSLRTAQNPQPALDALGDPFGDKKPAAAAPSGRPLVAPDSLLNPNSDAKRPQLGGQLEQEFISRQHEFKEGCPSPKDLKRIADLTTNITPSEGDLPHDCPLGGAAFEARNFAPITYTWTASGLCHKPLYFEDVQLERYGHMAGPWVQPFASGAHFFLTVPILPYKMGLELPNECLYTLGYYRPGSCAPYLFDPLPLSVRGALFEAGAWVGGIALFP